ncbi:CRISPR-associated protein Csx3 [Desulfovibrio gilichinskyi]|uniref:CRISPR-associated protein (Cas_csx3) n=1 Tax=Desulfovibrio gilichinskyi TaxID=1519643 RepID=A0A1X7D7S9_9BACT|nr:CRISPR-associated protein Csx3 [Desulfovibrio gilichinskyi]SMF09975.1 CRISPR-associated protein (Cas_csx3) [Desulfovibrio gilichinskyi]
MAGSHLLNLKPTVRKIFLWLNSLSRKVWQDHLGNIFEETAKLDAINDYCKQAEKQAGKGNNIVLTGRAPVWMYLSIAHHMHGLAKSLSYDSPVTGIVQIFNHDPR